MYIKVQRQIRWLSNNQLAAAKLKENVFQSDRFCKKIRLAKKVIKYRFFDNILRERFPST